MEEAGAGRKKTPQGVALCRRRGRGLAVPWEVPPRVLEVLRLPWVELGFPWPCPWLPLPQLTRALCAGGASILLWEAAAPGPNASLQPLPSSHLFLAPGKGSGPGWGGTPAPSITVVSYQGGPRPAPCPAQETGSVGTSSGRSPSHTAPFPGPGVSLCALWAPRKAHAPPLGHVAQVAGSTVLRDGQCGG